MYCKELEKDYAFLLHKNGRGKHIVEVDNRLTNLQFFFLVNYLKYPQYIDYSPYIKGYTNVKDNVLFSEDELGDRIMVLLPEDDKVLDSVNVVTTKGDFYSIDFKPKRFKFKAMKFFSEPLFSIDMVTHTQSIKVPEPLPDDYNPFVNHKSFEKRFYIIASIFILLFLVSIHYIDSKLHNTYYVFLTLAPFGWVYFEHDYLFKARHYLKMLVFSILIMSIGYYAIKQNLIADSFTFFSVLTSSFLFLIFQKLLSSIYIFLFKKRPDYMNESSSTKYLYEVPLLLITIFSSIFLYDVYAHLLA
ncbi:hypothetical protein [Psychroserpens sp. MEBiC05023]